MEEKEVKFEELSEEAQSELSNGKETLADIKDACEKKASDLNVGMVSMISRHAAILSSSAAFLHQYTRKAASGVVNE